MALSPRMWRPWLLLLACTSLALGGSIITQLPVELDGLGPALRPLLVLLLLVAFVAALLRPGLAGWQRRCARFRLVRPRLGVGALVFLVSGTLIANYGALLLLTWLLEPEAVWVNALEGLLGRPGGLSVLLVLLLLSAPLIEELLLRGRLQGGLARHWGVPAAIAVPAVVFAWLHGIPALVPVYTVFGALLGLVAWWSGSVWPAVIIHALHNGATLGLFLLARSAGVQPDDTAAGDTAALLPVGSVTLALGASLLGLALRLSGPPPDGGAVRWAPLLWLAPVLAAAVLAPVVWP